MNFKEAIRIVPDFPKEGIMFKDITTLLKDGKAFKAAIDTMSAPFRDKGVDIVVGPEARGFLIGTPMALELAAGFVPLRKPGKLPCATTRHEYSLEYGTDALELHTDSIEPGQKVLIADDLLATGGTIEAAIKLVEKLGGEVVGLAFLIELEFLNGRERLEGYEVFSLVKY